MKIKLILSLLVTLLNFFIVIHTNASVTIVGNRIVYKEKNRTMDVLLKNNDKIPYIMEVWVDNGNEQPRLKDPAGAPFILLPPFFKIEPLTSRSVRLQIKNATDLPRDRESLFWLNVLQIPPSNLNESSKNNSILFLIKNRLKLFYRPHAIGEPVDIFSNVNVSIDKEQGLNVENNRPWYLSLSNVSVSNARTSIDCTPETIAPYSSKNIKCTSSLNNMTINSHTHLSAFNDQGARASATFPIKK